MHCIWFVIVGTKWCGVSIRDSAINIVFDISWQQRECKNNNTRRFYGNGHRETTIIKKCNSIQLIKKVIHMDQSLTCIKKNHARLSLSLFVVTKYQFILYFACNFVMFVCYGNGNSRFGYPMLWYKFICVGLCHTV